MKLSKSKENNENFNLILKVEEEINLERLKNQK